MDQVLLQSDRIKFCIKLLAICLEGICARTVISQDLSLIDCLVFLAIQLDCSDFCGLLSISGSLFLGRTLRWLIISSGLGLGIVSLNLIISRL